MLSRSSFKTIAIASVICFCFFSIAQARVTHSQDNRPEPPKLVRKSGGLLVSEATNREEPVYPPLAKAARVSGAVVVEVTIDEEGKVIAARALSGHPLLKDAALNAAQRWTFKPTQLSGVPVKVIGTITFNFHLPNSSNEIETLKNEIRSNPNSAELYYLLGMAYSAEQQNDEAVEAFNRAIQLKPDHAEAYSRLGHAYMIMRQFDKAIEALKQSLAIQPDNARTLMELARCYMIADKREDALEPAKQALSLEPALRGAVEPYIIIGMSLFKQNRYAEAIEAFKDAVKLNPDMSQIRLHLGRAYFMVGDREAAMNEYKLLKERDPEAAKRLMEFLDKK